MLYHIYYLVGQKITNESDAAAYCHESQNIDKMSHFVHEIECCEQSELNMKILTNVSLRKSELQTLSLIRKSEKIVKIGNMLHKRHLYALWGFF